MEREYPKEFEWLRDLKVLDTKEIAGTQLERNIQEMEVVIHELLYDFMMATIFYLRNTMLKIAMLCVLVIVAIEWIW